MSRSDAHPSASSSSASDSGCANAAAGPPVPIVVNLDNRWSGAIRIGVMRSGSASGRPATIARAARQGSPTPSVTTTSPGRTTRNARWAGVVEGGRPDAPRGVRDRVEDEAPGHPFPRCIAPTDEVGHDRDVGEPERLAELTVEMARSLDDVRDVDRDQAPVGLHACRLERRPKLGRVVAVVVDHRDAVALADELEASIGAREPRESRCRLLPVHADTDERLERRGRVAPVVLAGNGEHEVDGLELPPPHDLRDVREPCLDRRLELGCGPVRRVMVELDVRHDRDPRPQRERGAVGLVALDDEPARPRAGVAAELRDDPSHDPGRVVSGLAQRVRDHRGRRRLAVRAGDDDRRLRRDQLGEECRARRPVAPGQVGRRDDRLEALGRQRARLRGRSRLPRASR